MLEAKSSGSMKSLLSAFSIGSNAPAASSTSGGTLKCSVKLTGFLILAMRNPFHRYYLGTHSARPRKEGRFLRTSSINRLT